MLITRLLSILTYLSGLDFIEDLWDGLTTLVSKVVTFFAGLFESVVSIFWTSGESGGLTIIGWLMLISISVGMFWLAIKFISGLVRGMRKR